jgi:hypothetical protein
VVAGSLDSIATVLSDLGAKLRDAPLLALVPAFERSVLQRLGYLLDFVKQPECANMLHDHLRKARPLPWVELEPHRRARSKHWASDKAALFCPRRSRTKKRRGPLPVDPGVIMVELP